MIAKTTTYGRTKSPHRTSSTIMLHLRIAIVIAALLIATRMQAALTDNLAVYYSLDEASGAAIDAHSTHDLTETSGTIDAASGKVSGARDFESGDTEYFDVADHADISVGNIDFTITGWVWLESVTAGHLALKGDGDDLEYDIQVLGGPTRLRFRTSSATGFTNLTSVDSGTVSTGAWLFVAAWHDATANEIAIQINNGTPVTAAYSAGSYDSAAPFQIGAYSAFSEYSDGLIDEVGLWKRLLTSDERSTLYNSGNGFAYPFDSSSGPIWYYLNSGLRGPRRPQLQILRVAR
jgi:hypothetical protein